MQTHSSGDITAAYIQVPLAPGFQGLCCQHCLFSDHSFIHSFGLVDHREGGMRDVAAYNFFHLGLVWASCSSAGGSLVGPTFAVLCPVFFLLSAPAPSSRQGAMLDGL